MTTSSFSASPSSTSTCSFPEIPIFTGWKRAYYAENLERLVATKHAVDPHNRFRHAQSIPTALS